MTGVLGVTLAVLAVFNGLVLAYFVVLNTAYLATSLIAFRDIRRYVERLKSLDLSELLSSEGVPPVTIIAPAYNEEPTCVESTRSLLGLEYQRFEILFVNDGSRDNTLARMQEAFDLVPAARLPTADLATTRVRKVYQRDRKSVV